ncbi:hypothetical protein SAMN04487969_11577 [Paenibacillus algorifonticola]|uniref:Uncharacterized protein n=1 Tax=Paenibacillus algorifonticola TaxID=684063 RepID=A0A1I2GBG1_9BACL|nr:hypothetical protein [Paenibacillus algorifonticola]SFF14513.1 hypothetical protein SAMN04487969_11577 [Paenibacillus algorifonticola]
MTFKRKYMTTPFLVLMLFFVMALPISAEAVPLNNSELLPAVQAEPDVIGEVESIQTDWESSIALSPSELLQKPKPANAASRLNYNVEGDILYHSSSLTASNPQNFYFFSLATARSIIFRIQSSNASYRVDLYQIDWNTGTAYPTGVGNTSGNLSAANNLPAGDFGLLVTSTGALEASYNIQSNASAPSGAVSYNQISSLLQSVVWEYSNQDLYLNNKLIANTTDAANTNPQLDWERVYYFSYGGSYQSRTHSISDARVNYITTAVDYHSTYASSNNAVLIVLKEETLFTYHYSTFASGPPTQYFQTFVDTKGFTTPRRLGFLDMIGNPHILVYDLNTNKVIDFVSGLNYYYANGIEPAPTVNYYN